jgi:rRNA-processing protein FCF1
MKVLMDADCLIKLTKAKLKELVCKNFTVIIPQTVKEEVVDNAQGHPDTEAIKENLDNALIMINKSSESLKKGEDAIFAIYKLGKFDAICSDDKRFIKRLRLFDIPYVTPAIFIAILLRNGKLTVDEACKKLDLLAPFVSDDEYSAIKLILENWRVQ